MLLINIGNSGRGNAHYSRGRMRVRITEKDGVQVDYERFEGENMEESYNEAVQKGTEAKSGYVCHGTSNNPRLFVPQDRCNSMLSCHSFLALLLLFNF
jgi:hypothetical protein